MTGDTHEILQQHLCKNYFLNKCHLMNSEKWYSEGVKSSLCDGCVKWSQPYFWSYSFVRLRLAACWWVSSSADCFGTQQGQYFPIFQFVVHDFVDYRLWEIKFHIHVSKFELSSWIKESMNTMLFLLKRDDLYEACLAYPYVPLCWMNSTRQILVFCSLNIWYAQKESLRIPVRYFVLGMQLCFATILIGNQLCCYVT